MIDANNSQFEHMDFLKGFDVLKDKDVMSS